MDERVCTLVSGQNGLIVPCLGEDCRACRSAVLVPDGDTVSLCIASARRPIEGGR